MKRKIAMLIAGILLGGIVTAGVVPYLSNVVTGSVEVQGPVFYTSSGNELTINEEPSTGYWNGITDIPYVKREWKMDEANSLNGIDFYKPEINFIAYVKIEEPFNNSLGLELEFGYYEEGDNSAKHSICSVQYISIDSQEQTIDTICPTDSYEYFLKNGEITDVNKFYYSFETLNEEYTYKIKTKDTYVKILGVVE